MKDKWKIGKYLQYVRQMIKIIYVYEGLSQINVLKTKLKNGQGPERAS